MGTYLGEVRITKSTSSYFFYPFYELVNGEFIELSEEEQQEIFPGSYYLNVNLFSPSFYHPLEDLFQNGDDVLIEFNFQDLQENYRSDGTRYQTAWKLDLSKLGNLAVRHMEDLGYNYLVDLEWVEGDWQNDSVLYLNSSDLKEDMKVVIATEKENVLIGPYKVHWDEEAEKYYVRLLHVNNPQNKIVQGFRYLDDLNNHLEVFQFTSYFIRKYIRTTGSSQIIPYTYDRISTEELMENFCEILATSKSAKGLRFDSNTAQQMLGVYKRSLLGHLNDEDAQQRVQRLLEVLDANILFDQTADRMGTLAGNLIYNHQDKAIFRAALDALAKDEVFLEHVPSFREFIKQEEKRKKELADLQAQKELLSDQVQELVRLNPEQRLVEAHQQIDRLETLKKQLEEKLQEIIDHTNLIQSFEDLKRQSDFLNQEHEDKERQIAFLEERLQTLQEELNAILERSAQKAMEMNFDTLIAAHLTSQNERHQRETREATYRHAAQSLQSMARSHLDSEQLVALVVQSIQMKRPEYSENDILNFLICFSQGFLTLLCGPSGSGKTTICQIVAESLGLMKPQELQTNSFDSPYLMRFAQVGVEKGWSSRRDLIGYYNALSQTFEKANPNFYDLLFILDAESRLHTPDVFPAFVLLDNANLSAMEYYWSDFLSMNEDQTICGTLNLGQSFQVQVPNTLHFMASIQSDHTSQSLSPRLLDRAWVISMPEMGAMRLIEFPDSFTPIQTLSQAQLESAFGALDSDLIMLEHEMVFAQLLQAFSQAGMPISIRSQKAIRTYVAAGTRLFHPTPEQSAEKIALDYAILQRLLPKINGSSLTYRNGLEAIHKLLEDNQLMKSKTKLEQIMATGDAAMQYYQFFA